MQQELTYLKQKFMVDNALKLKIVIDVLMAEIKSNKKKSAIKINTAKAIASCVTAQMKLFDDVPSSFQTEIYLKILNSPEGRIGRQTLLENSDDNKATWDAIQNLEQENSIESSDDVLIVVQDDESHN
jgi:predicted dinucleotide-binding enzyme